MGRGTTHSLEVRNFAQIKHAKIEFGDLTVLVGPQGAGKSLLLQLWKLALDEAEIIPSLRDAGHDVEDDHELLDVYFGQGMSSAWSRETRILIDGQPLLLASLRDSRKTHRPGAISSSSR